MKTKKLLAVRGKPLKMIRNVFGLIYIIAGVVMSALVIYIIVYARPTDRLGLFLKGGLPFLAGVVLIFISGIYTIKGKHWLWAIIGLIITVLEIVLLFSYIISIAMTM